MQDRFKFRVYLKYNQIMCDIDSYCFLQGLNKCVFHFTNGGQKTLKNDDFILMQSTGLKDKNGKLIYEGDIVKIFHVSGTMQGKLFTDVVEWNKLRCRFDTERYGVFNDDDIYEVIGNIYENPELLED